MYFAPAPAPAPGVFITGLDFGTPPQELQLLIDTGSGITHVAGAGCGSSCGLGLPETAGYNASASSTSQAVPCGDACSCPHCLCATEGMQEPSCAYGLQYGGWRQGEKMCCAMLGCAVLYHAGLLWSGVLCWAVLCCAVLPLSVPFLPG